MSHDESTHDSSATMAVAGLTLGLFAVAGAGAYLFGGPRGVRNRRKLMEWVRARFDSEEVNRDMVLAVGAAMARRFTRFSKLSAAELAEVVDGLTGIWRTIDKPRGRNSSRLKSP